MGIWGSERPQYNSSQGHEDGPLLDRDGVAPYPDGGVVGVGAGGDVPAPGVPGTDDDPALEVAFAERSAAVDAGGRTIGSRLEAVPYYVREYFGIPAIALSAVGCWWIRTLRDRLALAIFGWGLSCALFMAIGILTPMDMRYYLAAVPAVALTAACGASRAWQMSAAWRGAAVLLLAGVVAAGIASWWGALG